MGTLSDPPKALLVVSVLASGQDRCDEAVKALKDEFGDMLYISKILPFNYTNYYEPEMGPDLVRRFVAVDLVDPGELADIKLRTNEIEERWSEEGNRRVNLDPGLLSMHNFVLATTKAYTHRIYLRDCIWAEVTLVYQKRAFHPLPWTYPDYAGGEIMKILTMLRNILKTRLRDRP